jgi:hypothetical protein
MRSQSLLVVTFLSTLGHGVLGCSSSSSSLRPESDAATAHSDASPVSDASAREPYTVLITGTLLSSTTESATLYANAVGATRTQAQAGGDTAQNAFLNKDPLSDAGDAANAPHEALTIDSWTSLESFNDFLATSAEKTFLSQFYSGAADISTWQRQAGFTTWGGEADFAPGTSNYVITLRGRYMGDLATAMATHNGIVASIPAPGPQALGNSAHLIFGNPADSGEMLIIEVWTNETNQEEAYSQLAPALAKLWASMPAITRWTTTDWASWP